MKTPPMNLSQSETILVTGGAGFIGSCLIGELNRRGFDNIVVADFLGSDDKFLNLVGLRFSDYLEGDKLLELVRKNDSSLRRISHIFHLGACSSTAEHNASYLMANNYEYSKALAHFACGGNIRFVYASSAATYGDGSCGMGDKIYPNLALRPLNAYGYSKQLFDVYAAKHGLPVYGLKYFNVFGPNEYHKGEMRSMVLKAYESILKSGKVSLFKSHREDCGDGCQMRDFIYVTDAVNMTIFLANVGEFIDGQSTVGTYNIGSGMASTWNELVVAVFEAMGREPNIDYVAMPDELRPRYQYYTRADISKIVAAGYVKPITPLKEAVADYVQNYLIPVRRFGAI
jgi:ADP-L-glycero-D-manno-heptose 6-epimerase